MELESVILKLPRTLLSGAQRVATARDVTIGHMVRQLLKREVERQLTSNKPEDTDQRLLIALQTLLARDLDEAGDWNDLAERLRPHGYEIRKFEGSFVLFKTSCATRICKMSELGLSDDIVVERFGDPITDCAQSKPGLGIMPSGNIDPTRHAILCKHIEMAKGWPDLINRLACEGMELRLLGAALGVYIAATGRHLCNSTAVGAEYGTLVKRYGKSLLGESDNVSALSTPQDVTEGEAISAPA